MERAKEHELTDLLVIEPVSSSVDMEGHGHGSFS
jgi:hypothetical protein